MPSQHNFARVAAGRTYLYLCMCARAPVRVLILCFFSHSESSAAVSLCSVVGLHTPRVRFVGVSSCCCWFVCTNGNLNLSIGGARANIICARFEQKRGWGASREYATRGTTKPRSSSSQRTAMCVTPGGVTEVTISRDHQRRRRRHCA